MEIKAKKIDENKIEIQFGADKIHLDSEQAMALADSIVNEIIIEDLAKQDKLPTQEEIDNEMAWEDHKNKWSI
jgi:hypothetical protein